MKGKNVTDSLIKEFTFSIQYFTNNIFAKLLTGIIKTDEIDYIDILSEVYNNDLKEYKNKSPLWRFSEKNKSMIKLNIDFKGKQYIKTIEFLKDLKYFLELPNEIEKTVENMKSLLSIMEEKDNNYVITNDNFNKMILVHYRIKSNIPVIIMGETGCGKTALILKLNQLLNNGELKVEIINIHPGMMKY